MTNLPDKRNGDSLNFRLLENRNSLNFIRLFLAFLVLFAHSFPLLGIEDGRSRLGALSVNLFFVISGYLIFASASRSGLFSYIWKRFLRIFPGYWLSLIFIAFIAYPLANYLGHASGFSFSSAIHYLVSNYDLKGLDWGIEDSPLGVPYENAWNGSTWTLGYEFLCYLLLIPLAFLPYVKKYPKFFVTLAYVGSLFLLPVLQYADATTNMYYSYARFFPLFLSGALVYVWGDVIKVKNILVIFALVLTIAIYVINIQSLENFTNLVFSYAILGLGAILPVYIGTRNDISYGVYIYAFPLQQIFVMLGSASWGPYINTVAVGVVSAAFGFISWKFVEKPVMKLKFLIK